MFCDWSTPFPIHQNSFLRMQFESRGLLSIYTLRAESKTLEKGCQRNPPGRSPTRLQISSKSLYSIGHVRSPDNFLRIGIPAAVPMQKKEISPDYSLDYESGLISFFCIGIAVGIPPEEVLRGANMSNRVQRLVWNLGTRGWVGRVGCAGSPSCWKKKQNSSFNATHTFFNLNTKLKEQHSTPVDSFVPESSLIAVFVLSHIQVWRLKNICLTIAFDLENNLKNF